MFDFLLALFRRGDFEVHAVDAGEEEVVEYLALEELLLVPAAVYALQ